jgi:drug/metabolite transporter (DMT)-like permease
LTPTATLVTALAVTGGLATGAFAVQVWAQQLVPAHTVALIFAFEPACAAWLAWLFLGEQLDAAGLLGSGLILTAVIVGGLAQKQ